MDEHFLRLVNDRYTVIARDPANGHLPRPTPATLAMVLSWQEPRVVAKDWTVLWRKRRLQIDARHAALRLPGCHVQVTERRDGTLAILHDRRPLTFRDAPAPAAPATATAVAPPRKPWRPAADHPWKKDRSVCRPSSRPPPTSYVAHSRGAESRTAATITTAVTESKKRGHFY